MNEAATAAAVEKHAAAVDDLSSAVAATGVFGIEYDFVLKPLGTGPTDELFQLFRGRLEPCHIFEIDVDAVLAADVIAEAAAHTVHVVGELEDPGIDAVDPRRRCTGEAVVSGEGVNGHNVFAGIRRDRL